MTLSGMKSDDFGGALVQGRQAANGTTPAGAFINFNSNTQVAPCMPAMVLTSYPGHFYFSISELIGNCLTYACS